MHYRTTWLIAVTVIALVSAGCVGGAPDPGNNDSPDVDTPADVGVDADVAIDPDADADVIADPDATEVGPDADTSSPPPTPEDWDCDPDFQLDPYRYVDLKELDAQDFVVALHERVDGHNDRGYDDARQFMFHDLEIRDDGNLECLYTYDRVQPDGSNTPQNHFNTEHTWPQSRGADSEPERSDVHHLFPVQMEANSQRANHEFGHVACDESSCPWEQDGSYLGPSADDNRDPVFEVRPDRRGDVARAILYFSLRYEEPISAEEEQVLRQWNCENPPDTYERNRNDAVENFQNNRNPFIDRPDFVDRIEVF